MYIQNTQPVCSPILIFTPSPLFPYYLFILGFHNAPNKVDNILMLTLSLHSLRHFRGLKLFTLYGGIFHKLFFFCLSLAITFFFAQHQKESEPCFMLTCLLHFVIYVFRSKRSLPLLFSPFNRKYKSYFLLFLIS